MFQNEFESWILCARRKLETKQRIPSIQSRWQTGVASPRIPAKGDSLLFVTNLTSILEQM